MHNTQEVKIKNLVYYRTLVPELTESLCGSLSRRDKTESKLLDR